MRYVYPCQIIGNDEEGEGFTVTFPDVYGANTGGDTYRAALELAEDCLLAALAAHVYRNWDLPIPSHPEIGLELVAVAPMAAAKLALYAAMREEGLTRESLAEKLGLTEATVKRLLEPDRHSPWSQITKALSLVGRKLAVEDLAA